MSADVSVLLAEDNPADAELILECLSDVTARQHVHRVHDGVEALEFLLSRGPYANRDPGPPLRLVLLDIKLPRLGGLEVLEGLRRAPRWRFVPVVMLTSSRVERDVAAAYRLGANGYVQKPVDFVLFRDVLRTLSRYWLVINEPPPCDDSGAG